MRHRVLLSDRGQQRAGHALQTDPEIYLKAAEALRLRPEECVVFEDARAGIEAGDRAGMKVVALATTLSREELERTAATLVIDDFTQMSVERLRSL